MTHAELLVLLQRAGAFPYESPTRGALCLRRLSWGLPPSEELPLLNEAQRAQAAITRTIRHPHRHHRWLDQFGNGEWFELEREVTQDGARWTFKVTVLVRKDGTAVIDDANLLRPGDGGDSEETAETTEEDVADYVAPPLRPAQIPVGMVACPCCGRATLSSRGAYQICPVCFWEDDGQDSADADVARGGPNAVSLTEGRRNYLAFGASALADRAKVRRPVDEEAVLRRFDADGRELPAQP